MKNYKYLKRITVIMGLISLLFSFSEINAQEYSRAQRLKGYWKFSIGDRPEWALKNFDDSDWEEIFVPSTWEDEGFNGYDGYAWYRKEFSIDEDEKNKKLVLKLGKIDDVDEVFLNGVEIGKTGEFPPDYITAWELERIYTLPKEYLEFGGKNVIAVRVYDHEYGGGIYSGEIGIFEMDYGLDLFMALDGKWKFSTGDNLKWKEPGMNDGSWKYINVPARWEFHGYYNYDGFAWYRKTFSWTKSIPDEYVVLVLGKIDDIDEVYLNGQLVGSTGDMIQGPLTGVNETDWNLYRGYLVNKNLLKYKNILAVRVYDARGEGGIWDGPIGITTLDEYKDFLQSGKKKGKFFLGF